jgi:amino acid adenylation domain-containing protein
MLFQALLDGADSPSSGFDVEQMHITLQESLDAEALRKAWSIMLDRHPILSSSFRWEGVPEPRQIVNRGVSVPIDFENWTELDEQKRAARLEEFLLRDRHRGFDMRVAPLTRVKVFEVGNGHTELIWTFHHILLDGRSLSPLLQELFSAYDAIRSGQTPALPEKPRPYGDYIQWLGTLDHTASQQYFRGLLAGKTTPTPLPSSEPAARPLPESGYGESLYYVEASVMEQVRQVAQRAQVTVATLVHAAWALVLARYTGDSDVTFGYIRACRRSALEGHAESIVGLFINALPMRARLDADRTVAELLADLRHQSLAVRAYEHTSLVEIQRQSELPPGSPLFETLVMYESQGMCQRLIESGPRWANSKIALHEQPSLPLNLTIYDGSRFEVRALFDRRRFLPSAIDRLLASLAVALEQLTYGDQRRVSEIDVIPSEQRQRMLFDWNDTARAFPDQICIHEPFEAQVLRTPSARAVEMNGLGLTYQELEDRSNRLAHALRARGARPGMYVGICLSRGFDLIVTLLGVAKSGAAYVPLDPQYPRERLAFMLSDTGAPFVVSEQRYRDLFDVPLLVLDSEAGVAELESKPVQRPERVSSPEDVCYAIFTSGSTGVPKGVVLCHRAVVNTFDWVTRTFEFGPADRLLFVTSPCFDLSVYDTFGVLGAGGTVVIASSELLRDPAALANAIVEQQITVWDSAPAALQRLVPFIPATSKEAPLRLVMLSGDWIPITLPDLMRNAFPRVQLKSLGGATEAAIWSNWFPIGEINPRWNSVPYGKPIQNSRYHVLDERMRPVPIGTAGDLYIGGTCLANGYLNREELTRERFLPDPFRPGERLYKTGDLARYFEDGNLEFLGRADFQVKIRGFRVEMGEVEAVLCGVTGVREAVCAAHGDASGQKSLIAYVVAEDGVILKEDDLKASVAAKLPDFMVPSQVMLLAAMPLSQNGKLDRKALPKPGSMSQGDAYVAPRTDLERGMAAIWEDVLQRKPIGIREDFFKLGGHSLLAVMLVSRVKAQLDVDIPLSRMMDHPTIESLVQSIARPSSVPGEHTHLVTLCATGKRLPLFLFPGAGGYSFIYRDLPALLGEDQPVYTLQAIGAEDESQALGLSIEDMAQIYVREILGARPNGPYVLAGYSFGVLVAYEVARQLHALGHSVPLLISLDGYAPGYPQLLPMSGRLLSHLKAFVRADAHGRSEYLKARAENLKRRVLQVFGREHELIEDIPFADEEMNQRMRKLWAHFWQARNRYRPQGVQPCDMLLIKTEVAEEWIGTRKVDPLYGWVEFVTGDVSVVTIPGVHLMLFEASNQGKIAQAIAQQMLQHTPPKRVLS